MVMKNFSIILTCCCLLLACLACPGQTEINMTPNNDGSTQPAADPLTKALAVKSNAFAADLYAQLSGGEGNLFFSPGSIHIAMTMAYFGSAGQTRAFPIIRGRLRPYARIAKTRSSSFRSTS